MPGRLKACHVLFTPRLSSVYDTGAYPSVFGAKLFGNVPEERFLCLQNKRCDMMGLKSVFVFRYPFCPLWRLVCGPSLKPEAGWTSLCCPNRFIPRTGFCGFVLGRLGLGLGTCEASGRDSPVTPMDENTVG